MVVEVIEAPNGWPLGLGNISLRLVATQDSPAPAAAPAPGEQSRAELPSSSFSSFSSSDLDTESTVSFFPDKSVSLGLLMGMKPGNRGSLQFSKTTNLRQQHRSLSSRRSNDAEVSVETSQGLCVPLLQNVMEKMSRTKSTSRH